MCATVGRHGHPFGLVPDIFPRATCAVLYQWRVPQQRSPFDNPLIAHAPLVRLPDAPSQPVHYLALRGYHEPSDQAFSTEGLDINTVRGPLRFIGRTMLVPVEGDGDVVDVVAAKVLTVDGPQKDLGQVRWTLVGVSARPWTTRQAHMVLTQVLGPRDLFCDPTEVFRHDTFTHFASPRGRVPWMH